MRVGMATERALKNVVCSLNFIGVSQLIRRAIRRSSGVKCGNDIINDCELALMQLFDCSPNGPEQIVRCRVETGISPGLPLVTELAWCFMGGEGESQAVRSCYYCWY